MKQKEEVHKHKQTNSLKWDSLAQHKRPHEHNIRTRFNSSYFLSFSLLISFLLFLLFFICLFLFLSFSCSCYSFFPSFSHLISFLLLLLFFFLSFFLSSYFFPSLAIFLSFFLLIFYCSCYFFLSCSFILVRSFLLILSFSFCCLTFPIYINILHISSNRSLIYPFSLINIQISICHTIEHFTSNFYFLLGVSISCRHRSYFFIPPPTGHVLTIY